MSADVPRLTSLSHGGGCACKIGPEDLGQVLRQLPPVVDPSVLVGFSTSDDAAIVKLAPDLAAVATVDFFTPIVDDPRDFGRIAATNAISDVYAMGGRPLFALSVIGFPTRTLPMSTMGDILKGGAEICAQAGVSIVGGHSIDDPEPKFGLAVYGLVHPDRVVRNSTAQAGDVLVLSKAIGTGVVTQGLKRGEARADEVAGAVASMTTLNRAASEAMVEVGVHAATDVTGFGLLGHLGEMTAASRLAARVQAHQVPLLPGARRLAEAGLVPGGSRRNHAHVSKFVSWGAGVDEVSQALLADAQTSGGLLMSVPPAKLERLRFALAGRGVAAAVIGEIVAGEAGTISVE
jgi:selenide,water dikinase